MRIDGAKALTQSPEGILRAGIESAHNSLQRAFVEIEATRVHFSETDNNSGYLIEKKFLEAMKCYWFDRSK